MDFVFMLTRADRTVPDAMEVLDDLRGVELRHIGFKDVGATPQQIDALHRRIKELGAVSYMEMVSTSPQDCVASAKVAREVGIDRLLGGCAVEEVMGILAGSQTAYLPFPGRPHDHPTRLGGTAEDVERDCARFAELGCVGVDLLAHRATEAQPTDLIRAARRGTPGVLLVAGGVGRPEQVKALAAHGVDAFTVGSAVFDGSFAPNLRSLRSQLGAVLDACR